MLFEEGKKSIVEGIPGNLFYIVEAQRVISCILIA